MKNGEVRTRKRRLKHMKGESYSEFSRGKRGIRALTPLLERSRQALLGASDSVCLERARLVTEAYRMHAGDPAPILRAKSLHHVLSHMTLDLDTNPILAGNTSSGPRAWMLVPEYGFEMPAQAPIESTSLAGLLEGDAIPRELRAFWRDRSAGGPAGCGHLAIDNQRLLARGLNDFIAEAETLLDDPDSARAVYRQASVIGCRAVIHWGRRFASAAQDAAESTNDPVQAAALRRAARACRQVPAGPARNLFEALQSIALVHLAIHIEGHGYSVSPGRLDQLLLPYYDNDPDAVELLAAFMLKLAANSLWGSHSKTQAITVGGVDERGADQSNPLTLLILDACEQVCLPDPALFLRWHQKTSIDVKRKAMGMLTRGFSMPILLGDAQTASGLANAGVSTHDAWDYCVIGCNELGVPGKLIFDAIALPEAALLRDLLLADADLESISSMDALLDRLTSRAADHLCREATAHADHVRHVIDSVPTPFTSALMSNGIKRGNDLREELTYPFLNVRSSGFANLINALSAINTAVFEDKTATLSALRAAVRTNFENAEPLRSRLLQAPKWGNDDNRADQWAASWIPRRHSACRSAERESGLRPLLMEMVVRSLHHLEGRRLGATPDGRLAGSPLADSIGPAPETACEGPTALLTSVSKLQPSRYWRGGYNLNLTLPASLWHDEFKLESLRALVDVFFRRGGQELQINVFDADVLRDAQVWPQKYPNLLVRIAGFNALFSHLSRLEQDELIRRAEAYGVPSP